MIKDNQQHFNRLHVVLDGLVVIVSYALAWWLKLSGIFTNDHVGVLSFEFYMFHFICCYIMRLIYIRRREHRAGGLNYPILLWQIQLEF